jgi:hypothetical protein
VYEIQSPTRALANIKSAVDNLTLGSNGALTVLPNNADTRPDLFGGSFKQYLTNYIGSSTATRRKQYVFLVTDGVAGVVGGAPPAGVWLFNQSFCDQIKALNDPANGVPNIKVVVLYTKYLDERTDRLWNNLVGALYPNIEDNMKACASTPELYASGDTPTEIAAAFREILEGITSDAAALRLTQ